MSKSTKIVMSLGVAAALGVAAVPVASFAAPTNYTATGTVGVSATIPGSISMTINTDASTQSSTIADGATVAGYGAAFGNITAGKAYKKVGNTTIVVSTNQPNGYVLNATGADLVNGDDASAKVLVAGQKGLTVTSAAAAGETYSGASSLWGITVDVAGSKSAISGAADFGDAASNKFSAYTTTKAIDENKTVSTDISNTYTIGYGIGTIATQTAGTYQGTITYVATNQYGN